MITTAPLCARARCALAALVPALGALPAGAAAQTVYGVVSERGSSLPVRGAFISLVDSAGTRQRAFLTDEAGRYIMRAPAPGAYLLRAERIGYESVVIDSVSITGNEARSIPIALPVSALRLPELNVSRAQRCVANPQRAVETARVWEEVRKALTVTSWLQEGGQAQFRVRAFERDLSNTLEPVGQERMSFDLFEGRSSFNAAPADSLSRFGFMQRSGTELLFFGPDAQLMTTPEFLDQHCFRLQRRNDRPGLLGLAFEPVRGRRLPDIKGALWLDLATGALRFLDYEFTNLGFQVDPRYANGRTEFEQLPNGAWIVRHWVMNTPLLTAPARNPRLLRASGARQQGGEVFDALLGDSAEIARLPVFTITGVVYDSLRARPIVDAHVYLAATQLDTRTDSAGAFAIEGVPRGEHYLTVADPRLDSIPALPPLLRLRVDSSTTALQLATTSRETLLGELCGQRNLLPLRRRMPDSRLSAVRIELTGDGGVPLGNVAVRLLWQDEKRNHVLDAMTGMRGQAILCGDLGPDLFYIELLRNRQTVRSGPYSIPPERILRLALTLSN